MLLIRTPMLVIAALAIALGLGVVATSAYGNGGTTYHACVNNASGTPKIVSADTV